MADAQLLPNMVGYQSFIHQLDPRIRPLRCTKEHLAERKYNIIRFTSRFYKINEHLGQLITRVVVEFFWVNEIWRLYPTGHPEKRRLIGQAHSPKYEVFWQKRLDIDAFKAKRERQTAAKFCSFPRQLSKEEKKDKGMVLLGNDEWEYVLPEVQLMPLYHICFLELAKKVMVANPGKPLSFDLIKRLWRLLIREVYDFVSETERGAKLEEAKVVTDKEFEEATRAVSESLSKKRGISPESDFEAESSKSRRKQSKKKKIVRFAENVVSDTRTGIDESEPESSTRPKPSAATNGQQPFNEAESSAQDPRILEQTERIAGLEAKLATAEQQIADNEEAKSLAEHKWRSQHGQLKAAERDARELRRANPNVAHYTKARNEAEHKMKSMDGHLRKANEKILELEIELRAQKGRTAGLEVSLARAGGVASGEKTTEAEEKVPHE